MPDATSRTLASTNFCNHDQWILGSGVPRCANELCFPESNCSELVEEGPALLGAGDSSEPALWIILALGSASYDPLQ